MPELVSGPRGGRQQSSGGSERGSVASSTEHAQAGAATKAGDDAALEVITEVEKSEKHLGMRFDGPGRVKSIVAQWPSVDASVAPALALPVRDRPPPSGLTVAEPPRRPVRGSGSPGPGTWALNTVNKALAEQICAARSLAELQHIELPFSRDVPLVGRSAHLGTWMVWMVHRVALDDPSLTELDFSSQAMPLPSREPRIARKLVDALVGNTHLRRLRLGDSNLQGGEEVVRLAAALVANRTLRALDVASNFFGPDDLGRLFAVLAGTESALEELYCSNQFCEPPGRKEFQALAEALDQNWKLRKLGLELPHPHWRDQINRRLIRNVEAQRKARWEAKLQVQAKVRIAAAEEMAVGLHAGGDRAAAGGGA
mmetsp:Transcript_87064/g.195042  ORF Transcript_87064/g.195042 Transcript_87064/m.195042 type:complete len:370 (+) Transcript_87064:294-1403(+)